MVLSYNGSSKKFLKQCHLQKHQKHEILRNALTKNMQDESLKISVREREEDLSKWKGIYIVLMAWKTQH